MTAAPTQIIDFSFKKRSFKIYQYPLSQTPPAFAKKLGEFYALWNTLRDGDKIPLRKDITFETLIGWHSNIRLVDFSVDNQSPDRNVILGETYKQYWGNDNLYNRFDGDDDKSTQNKENFKKCITCFMNYHYAISIGLTPNDNGSYQKIAWMDLPLSNTGDNKITHALTALIPLEG